MPIFFQHDINHVTKLAIWKIKESEDFYLSHVPLQRSITHPQKRLQHLAGRYLLQYLFPHFPIELIQIADTNKPFLENEAYHFSISHCGGYAAVIVSTEERVGIDLEIVSQKAEKVRSKFLSENEWTAAIEQWDISRDQPQELSTLLWSCKEAVFKWYGAGGVDFKKHIHVKKVNAMPDSIFHSIILFKKNEELFLNLHSQFFDELCLSYVLT
jgi:phosphopantetheinyl transferase